IFVFGLPRRASILWLVTASTAAAVLLGCVVEALRDPRLLAAAALYAVAGVIAETFHVPLPTSRPGNRVNMTVGAAIEIAAVLLFPLHWAVPAVGLAGLIGKRGTWYQRVFNGAQLSVSAAASALVWRLAGTPTPSDVSSAPALVVTCLVFF